MLFAMLMQVAANFINDLYDHLKGTDGDDRLGPARACASGWITPTAMRRGIVVVCIVACLCGLPLVYYGGWWLVAIGALCVLFAYLYTGGPYPLAYHGWGDVLVLVFFGLVPVGLTAWLQGCTRWGAMLRAGVACGLVIDTLLMVNNYRDRDTDRASGKRTVVVRLGEPFGRWAYLLLGVAAVLLVASAAYTEGRPWLLLPLLYLLPHAAAWRALVRIGCGKELNAVLGRTSMDMLIFGILTVAGELM
jgi:1,4-dihydroxy-2-naphthoate octaprenyltransferase